MHTRRWSLSLIVFLSLSPSPLRAEKPDAPALGQDEKDLCSYLKDVDSKTDADCAPDVIAALKTQNPSAFAQKLQLSAKRRADVHRAYDQLKVLSASDLANSSVVPPPAKKDEPDPLSLAPPINDRTFPAWIGADALDFKAVYGRWLQAQNAELEREQQGPVSDERRNQMTAQLAHNQEKIAGLEKIKDPAQLSCYLGDSCGTRGDESRAGVVGMGGRKTWTAEDFTRANARVLSQNFIPGGKHEWTLDASVVPSGTSPDSPNSITKHPATIQSGGMWSRTADGLVAKGFELVRSANGMEEDGLSGLGKFGRKAVGKTMLVSGGLMDMVPNAATGLGSLGYRAATGDVSVADDVLSGTYTFTKNAVVGAAHDARTAGSDWVDLVTLKRPTVYQAIKATARTEAILANFLPVGVAARGEGLLVGTAEAAGAAAGQRAVALGGQELGEESVSAVAYRLGRPVAQESGLEWALRSPQQKIDFVVEKYGYNLRDKSVRFDPSLPTFQAGKVTAADPRVLHIGPSALSSEEELAKTIAHESRHSRAYLGSGSNEEAAAQASEEALAAWIRGKK